MREAPCGSWYPNLDRSTASAASGCFTALGWPVTWDRPVLDLAWPVGDVQGVRPAPPRPSDSRALGPPDRPTGAQISGHLAAQRTTPLPMQGAVASTPPERRSGTCRSASMSSLLRPWRQTPYLVPARSPNTIGGCMYNRPTTGTRVCFRRRARPDQRGSEARIDRNALCTRPSRALASPRHWRPKTLEAAKPLRGDFPGERGERPDRGVQPRKVLR